MIVILSTHIVDDVADLCSRMAIISHGRVLAEGEPASAMAQMGGRIWRRVVDRADLGIVQSRHNVISTRLVAGKTVVHVFSDERPAGFDAVDPSLEDVYFSTLQKPEAA